MTTATPCLAGPPAAASTSSSRENVFGRVEYRYTDFGSGDFNTGSGPQSVEFKENRINFGVGMKF